MSKRYINNIFSLVISMSLTLVMSSQFSAKAEIIRMQADFIEEAKEKRNQCYQREMSRIKIPQDQKNNPSYKANQVLTKKKYCDQKYAKYVTNALKCQNLNKKIKALKEKGGHEATVKILQLQKAEGGCSF